jgi:predicted phosphodiesterase
MTFRLNTEVFSPQAAVWYPQGSPATDIGLGMLIRLTRLISLFFNRGEFMKPLRIPIIIWIAVLLVWPALAPGGVFATTVTFTGGELLGKPTNNSITINIVPASTIEYYYEYGTTQGGPYSFSTAPKTAAGGQPHEVVITGLSPNTRYYYRMIYDGDGDVEDGDYEVRAEHTFHTQRSGGTTFKFAVISDSHATFNTNHQNAMTNVLNDQPDFLVDLGDTFYPATGTTTQSQVNAAYLAYRDASKLGGFSSIGPAVPIFLSSGNHEEEEGWNLDDTPFSIGVGSIQARKAYFPTPVNDGFYSGNTDPLARIDEAAYGDEYREDYYAWEWGDALFVVIDPFQYTMNLPYTPAAGEGSDDAVTGNQWSWTLGWQQYQWLKQTLENSNAKYKFVFSHHVTGGITRAIVGVGAGYVRGGAEAAQYFEWGGKNADGTWGFDTQRPGWGGVPIHQLMVANKVSAYFHGHDHQYVYEMRDGIVYQEVPSPSMTGAGFGGIYTVGNYTGYRTDTILPNSGHLRVTVTPTAATVEYVRSNQTGVSHTYTIAPAVSNCPGDFNLDGVVSGDDLEEFAPNFGRTDCNGCDGNFDEADNDVDGSDLSRFIELLGTTCD